jgi:hypothetical protein
MSPAEERFRVAYALAGGPQIVGRHLPTPETIFGPIDYTIFEDVWQSWRANGFPTDLDAMIHAVTLVPGLLDILGPALDDLRG